MSHIKDKAEKGYYPKKNIRGENTLTIDNSIITRLQRDANRGYQLPQIIIPGFLSSLSDKPALAKMQPNQLLSR